jgi:hypothetical protein
MYSRCLAAYALHLVVFAGAAYHRWRNFWRAGHGRRRAPACQSSCSCILLVRQDRVEITVDRRTGQGWGSHVLRDGGETLSLPDFGLSCPVRAVYQDTPLG